MFTCRYDSVGYEGPGINLIKASFGNASVATSNDIYESSSYVQTTDWQHIVCTWEPGTIKMYLDTSLDTPSATNYRSPSSISNLSNFYIGTGAKANWNGVIDDVRIYDRVLSSSEVSTIYASRGSDCIHYGLIGHWPMLEFPPGTVSSESGSLKDVSISKMDGDPTGSPTYYEGILRFGHRNPNIL